VATLEDLYNIYAEVEREDEPVRSYDGTTINFTNGDFTIRMDNGNVNANLDPTYIEEYINQGSIGGDVDFTVLSPEESALQDVFKRLKDFHQWLKEEHEDLAEECGADLNGLVDKLEETFPELCGEPEMETMTPSPFIDFEGDFNRFRRQVVEALRVDPADVQVGYGSSPQDGIPY
jgi:hypothetical protein